MENEVRLTCRAGFSASHHLRIPEWSEEENRRHFGKAANPNGHGHNYVVEVTLTGMIDPKTGMVVNIKALKNKVKEILGELDHRNLNVEIPEFRTLLPTTENLAVLLWKKLDGKVPAGKLHRIRVYEEGSLWAEFAGPAAPPSVTRAYQFAAAHRLHTDRLSEEENKALYGECSNPHGHGHNYKLEVTVQGEPGSVSHVDALDRLIHDRIIEPWDHKNLDRDIPDFSGKPSTGENIAGIIWKKLEENSQGVKILSIKLEETPNSVFEYSGAVR